MNYSGCYSGATHRSTKDNYFLSRTLFERKMPVRAPRCQLSSQAVPFKDSNDRLSQRMRDMNISTSFVEESSSDGSSPRKADEAKQCPPRSPVVPSLRNQINKCNTQVGDKRQEVLELIGTMLDEGLISEEEATSSITLAMEADATFERMGALLGSRQSLGGKSSFLRLWLRGMKRAEPSPILPAVCSDDSEIFRPLARSLSKCNLEVLPVPSPPLVPVSLNFADEVDERKLFRGGGQMKLVRHSHSVSTPSTGMSPSPELVMGRLASQSSDDLN